MQSRRIPFLQHRRVRRRRTQTSRHASNSKKAKSHHERAAKPIYHSDLEQRPRRSRSGATAGQILGGSAAPALRVPFPYLAPKTGQGLPGRHKA